MFDLAWSHLLLIGVVALLVIGPKDLPRALRTVGVWVGRARTIAREFQGSLDQMIREAELEEVRKEVEQAATVDLDHSIESTIDPEGGIGHGVAEPPIVEEAAAPPASAPPSETPPPAVAGSPEPSPPPEGALPPSAEPPAGRADEAPAAEPKSGTHD
jgi:sec-independent protein translocase protein TatB